VKAQFNQLDIFLLLVPLALTGAVIGAAVEGFFPPVVAGWLVGLFLAAAGIVWACLWDGIRG